MSIAVGQVLEGMADPAYLHRIDIDDQIVIMVGSRALFCFAAADTGMRNLAVVMLTGMGFSGRQVAALMGLTPGYVSTLRGRARDHGSAGLVREMGRPTKLTGAQIAQAWRWRAQKVSDVVIGARLAVADTTVARALRDHPAPVEAVAQTPGELGLDVEPDAEPDPEPDAEPEAEPRVCRGSGRIGQGVFFSRYAGAMLLHAFSDRVGAGVVLSGAVGPGSGGVRFDEVALLAATSMAFALGAGTIEQVKHLTTAEAGLLCGLGRLPDLSQLHLAVRHRVLGDPLDDALPVLGVGVGPVTEGGTQERTATAALVRILREPQQRRGERRGVTHGDEEDLLVAEVVVQAPGPRGDCRATRGRRLEEGRDTARVGVLGDDHGESGGGPVELLELPDRRRRRHRRRRRARYPSGRGDPQAHARRQPRACGEQRLPVTCPVVAHGEDEVAARCRQRSAVRKGRRHPEGDELVPRPRYERAAQLGVRSGVGDEEVHPSQAPPHDGAAPPGQRGPLVEQPQRLPHETRTPGPGHPQDCGHREVVDLGVAVDVPRGPQRTAVVPGVRQVEAQPALGPLGEPASKVCASPPAQGHDRPPPRCVLRPVGEPIRCRTPLVAPPVVVEVEVGTEEDHQLRHSPDSPSTPHRAPIVVTPRAGPARPAVGGPPDLLARAGRKREVA